MQRTVLVGDDPTVTSVVRRGPSYAGHRVDTAATGPQALTLARDYAPDLVVLNLMLPGLSGLDVLEGLRLANVNLPVLMLTALDSADDEVKVWGSARMITSSTRSGSKCCRQECSPGPSGCTRSCRSHAIRRPVIRRGHSTGTARRAND